MTDPSTTRPAAIARWLLAVAVLVFAMVVVGGITRLTESGLSITEWKPVTGAIPPLTHAQWLEAFAAYQATPEYQQINRGMSLGDFQFIFFWEYVHRLLGRVIGLAFALPLAWFAFKRAIPKGYGWRLVALLALGSLQGALGWWMVVSGLAQRTDVSHLRLAAHLLTAFLILGGLVWTALDLKALARDPSAQPARLTGFTIGVIAVMFVQMLYGAFVAGLNAGLVTNEWPLMNGRVFPSEVLAGRGLLDAAVNDPSLVHFIHRWFAFAAAAALFVLAARAKRAGARGASIALHITVGTQILLGIATVWTGVWIGLAVTHQGVAALIVCAVAWGAHALGQSVPVAYYPSRTPQPA